MSTPTAEGLYFMHISVHGLIRGGDLELGRDADTGGQTKYVVELCRALGEDPAVDRVDLLTRQVVDPRVSGDYGVPLEPIGDNVFIRRITCGPRRYLRKESLWPYLHTFLDQALLHIRSTGRLPDIIHAHYADAGYVGRQLAHLLGCPFIFTGHSLGRVKRQRLAAKGAAPEAIEKKYHISRRIEAEELCLDAASLVVTSTRQEVQEQYELYEQYVPDRMRVIPPGVDLDRFRPPAGDDPPPPIADAIDRFLRDPGRPPVLALSRADERKNIETLVRAFGESPRLRERCNLVIVAGNRDRIREMDSGSRKVLSNVLFLIDDHDLHGTAAFPKAHSADDVPAIYRLAAQRRGVFVNPALTEPFGLTLLEAAASGLPVVATNDGGPRDILANCRNGELVDPLDPEAIARAVEGIALDPARWDTLSSAGLVGVRSHYTWRSHVETYLRHCRTLLEHGHYRQRRIEGGSPAVLPLASRLLVADLDNILTGDRSSLGRFRAFLDARRADTAFGIATGRDLEGSLDEIKRWEIPFPDVLITSLGTAIHYGRDLVGDDSWAAGLDYHWEPDRIRETLDGIDGLTLQEEPGSQDRFKISYSRDPEVAPTKPKIVKALRAARLKVSVFLSHGVFLDVVPVRASKGLALRYLSFRWGIPQGRILVAADSGNDIDMIRGDALGVVVRNQTGELDVLRGDPRIHYATGRGIDGILEGVAHYHFDQDEISVPEEDPRPGEDPA